MGSHTREHGDVVMIDGGDWHEGPVETQILVTTFTNDYRPSFDVQVRIEGEWCLITEDESLDNPPEGDELAGMVKDWFDDCDHSDVRISEETGVTFRCNKCGEGVR